MADRVEVPWWLAFERGDSGNGAARGRGGHVVLLPTQLQPGRDRHGVRVSQPTIIEWSTPSETDRGGAGL
jgi:hypothetical protein